MVTQLPINMFVDDDPPSDVLDALILAAVTTGSQPFARTALGRSTQPSRSGGWVARSGMRPLCELYALKSGNPRLSRVPDQPAAGLDLQGRWT